MGFDMRAQLDAAGIARSLHFFDVFLRHAGIQHNAGCLQLVQKFFVHMKSPFRFAHLIGICHTQNVQLLFQFLRRWVAGQLGFVYRDGHTCGVGNIKIVVAQHAVHIGKGQLHIAGEVSAVMCSVYFSASSVAAAV